MGDNRILLKKNLTKNDICRYMLSECSDYRADKHYESGYNIPSLSEAEQIQLPEDEMLAKKKDEDEYFDELDRAQQEEWDERQEYEDKLSEIEEKYPNFDAKEAAFYGEDPEEAERKARIDDYLNNWY